jgi:hypothetical protein
MSLPRHSFANIVPIDKSKLGTRVYSASQVTNMIKANTNTARPKRFAFGVSAYYRVNSGLLNDYAIIIRSSAADSIAAILASGEFLDGDGIDGLNLLILDGDGDNPDFILDGN